MYEILQIGHPLLKKRANEIAYDAIKSSYIQNLIDDMIATMHTASGAGLAANQIGILYRLIIIEVDNNPRYPYKPAIPLTIAINPKIKFLSDNIFISNEGCLSVPAIRADVNRHIELEVSYYDRDANFISTKVCGYAACVWQHELDHLDGILFPERVTDLSSFCSEDMFFEYKQDKFTKSVQQLVKVWGS